MKEKLIQKYVDMLSTSDIIKFAKSNHVELSDNEVNIIYRAIKNEWKNIIYGDYHSVLNQYKDSFTVDKLNKMEQFILLYKDKYKKFI